MATVSAEAMTGLGLDAVNRRFAERSYVLTQHACDTGVIFLVGALMTLGMVMVYSASVTIHGAEFDWRNWLNSPLKQCVFTLVGFIFMLFVAHLDYRLFSWERGSDAWLPFGLYILSAGLLALMFVPGIGRVAGVQRAIVIPGVPFTFQPAEFAKVVAIIWLAALLSRPDFKIQNLLRGYIPAIGSAAILIGLTGIEDFGTAALIGVITLFLLVLAGARWSHLVGTGLLGLAAGAYLIWMKPYRLQRITTFFSEQPNEAAEGYQVSQSLIAIGSGGWFGRGLGAGVQKYDYLPQDNNDFIFAVLCEELGVVGGCIVVLLFLLLLWRGWRLSSRAIDPFGRLLAAGVTLMLCLQAAFNIAVVTNSIPTKGISLPFVSAGGSGVLFLGLAAGLLASVGRFQIIAAPRRTPSQPSG